VLQQPLPPLQVAEFPCEAGLEILTLNPLPWGAPTCAHPRTPAGTQPPWGPPAPHHPAALGCQAPGREVSRALPTRAGRDEKPGGSEQPPELALPAPQHRCLRPGPRLSPPPRAPRQQQPLMVSLLLTLVLEHSSPLLSAKKMT